MMASIYYYYQNDLRIFFLKFKYFKHVAHSAGYGAILKGLILGPIWSGKGYNFCKKSVDYEYLC